jgi:hypothetical protein
MNPIVSSKKSKKFCKYCWDRGHSTEICFSHYVKDKKGRDGVIVCPELLKEQCMRCGEHGHTPRYCASATPLLTVDNPTGDAIRCAGNMLRLISHNKWIEPIPEHLRADYISWELHRKERALARRGRERARSRHNIFAEYDEDVGETMIGLVGCNVGHNNTYYEGLPKDRPYSDYELEVLAIIDVNREMFRECLPNGFMDMKQSDRYKVRAIVAASHTVFYALRDEDFDDVQSPDIPGNPDIPGTFHIHEIVNEPVQISGCMRMRDIIREHQNRVLAKLEIMKHHRDPVQCLQVRKMHNRH